MYGFSWGIQSKFLSISTCILLTLIKTGPVSKDSKDCKQICELMDKNVIEYLPMNLL